MQERRFQVLDVFTATALAGNQLAVVLDCDGLDGARMQAIAREFNLSETVFIGAPSDPRHRASLRIFTPAVEMPFAGHPLIGSIIALGLAGPDPAAAFGLELPAGVTSCAYQAKGPHTGAARFKSPALPRPFPGAPDAPTLAAALGLRPAEIGFARHAPSRHGVSLPMTFAPVADLAALGRITIDPQALAAATDPTHAAVYAYALDSGAGRLAFQARMFAPGLGVPEDPATGSAAAAFAGVMMAHEPLGDGQHDITLAQGVEMGRPSRIDMQMEIRSGALASVEIAGEAIVVMEGRLRA